MCNRHSFCLTPAGQVIDGFGLTESHTTIMYMHGIEAARQDTCNLYEWQPPQGWPETSWHVGLTVDKSAFATKQRAENTLRRHVHLLYPDMKAWQAPDPIRWGELSLPDAGRVHRAYDLVLRCAPLGCLDDATVLEHVNRHLTILGCKTKAIKVANADSVWNSVWNSVRASVWNSVRDSVWDSVRDSVRDSVGDSVRDSVRDSVECSMVREDAENPWLSLAELATHGVYLYGVADDGTAYVWREESP